MCIFPTINLWRAGRNQWRGPLMSGWLLTDTIHITFWPDLGGIQPHSLHLLGKTVSICPYHFSTEHTFPIVLTNLLLNILHISNSTQYSLKSIETSFSTFWGSHSLLQTREDRLQIEHRYIDTRHNTFCRHLLPPTILLFSPCSPTVSGGFTTWFSSQELLPAAATKQLGCRFLYIHRSDLPLCGVA